MPHLVGALILFSVAISEDALTKLKTKAVGRRTSLAERFCLLDFISLLKTECMGTSPRSGARTNALTHLAILLIVFPVAFVGVARRCVFHSTQSMLHSILQRALVDISCF